jgi:hypothetical protein
MFVERAIVSRRAGILILLALVFLAAPLGAVAPAQEAQTPPSVQDFVKLRDDPAVRSWLAQARSAQEATSSSKHIADSIQMASRLSGIREHLAKVVVAIPQFPSELRRASGLLLQELRNLGLSTVMALIGGFAALGYGSERLFWRVTKRSRLWIRHHPMTTVADRLRMITMRLGFGSLVVAIFGLGSVGAFLLFEWRPLLRQVAIAYLAAAVLFRLTLVLGRVVLVPNGTVDLDDLARFRVVPMPAEHARFWQRRLGLFIGYWAFGRATAAVSQGDRARPELRGRLRHGSVVPCLAQAQRLVG